MIHLIKDNLVFNEDFKTYFKTSDFHPPKNKEYQTLAIIGCQSSGKSTLLNHVFGTDFEVMTDDKGRGQTTQGIWAAVNQDFNTIVFDVEGTDAKERGDDRFKFEQCSSLFALAMADVLMINMWTNDIGRYTASNYGVLKIVFEMNLKLFQQESEKKIVIVLRDFDEDNDNQEQLQEYIIGDIKQIWEEIQKPESFKNCKPEDYFKFEFYTLAHKFYFEDKFKEGIEHIKECLKKPSNEKDIGKYLFNHVKYDKNVPIDGMYNYTREIWSIISNNKDLNIPNQKEMLARFRCNEIKDYALQEVENDILELENDSASRTLKDFKPRVNDILTKAFNAYDPTASDYLPHIYQDVKHQMESVLSQRLYSCFGNQLKRLIPITQKKFRIELEKQIPTTDNFIRCVNELKTKYLQELDNNLQELKAFDNWETSQSNESLLDEVIEHQRENALNNKKEEIVNKLLDLYDDALSFQMDEIGLDFWNNLANDTVQHEHNTLNAYKNFLVTNFNMKEDEIKPFMVSCENDLFDKFKTKMYRNSRDIVDYLVMSFKKGFWLDEGVPRTWNKLKVATINELYKKHKDASIKIFDLFTKFRTLKNPLEIINYDFENKKADKELAENIKNKMIENEESFLPFVNTNDLQGYKVKFVGEIDEIYQDALRRNRNIKQTSLPIWAWILLIYVSYADIWNFLTGKGIWLIPLFAGIYALLYYLGLHKLPFTFYNLIKSQFDMNKGKK